MATKHRRLAWITAASLLMGAAIAVGIGVTGGPGQPANNEPPRPRLIDLQPLQTAEQLEKIATTREELRFAHEAVRTADHAVDLAFSAALRDVKAHPPAQDAKAKPLFERVHELEVQVNKAEERVNKLADSYRSSTGTKANEVLNELQVADVQLVLRRDELDDARRALRRSGGDPESRLQQLFTRHKATYHPDQGQFATPQPSVEAFSVPGTMIAQLRLWKELRDARQRVELAKQQADNAAASLESKRVAMAAETEHLSQSTAPAAFDQIAENREALAEYDDRIQDQHRLGEIYGEWSGLLADRIRACTHETLQSALWIFFILVSVIAACSVVARITSRLGVDRRRRATVRLLGRFAVQVVGLLLILVVLLGSPRQLSTILAFAGAGLTIALKNFIVAFFGWFVLMGKNGIRVGDWVEVNGISGEVVEVGLFRTVLLETGNWADSGHPTGRRVTFVNSYAIEGHYFNFSTTGQWLWDSLEVLVPVGHDPYPITDAVLKLVVRETEVNARKAEQEWHQSTQRYGVQTFSAVPSIDLRPTFQGINMVVRYITRANERYEVRRRLYELVVRLLHQESAPVKAASAQ